MTVRAPFSMGVNVLGGIYIIVRQRDRGIYRLYKPEGPGL